MASTNPPYGKVEAPQPQPQKLKSASASQLPPTDPECRSDLLHPLLIPSHFDARAFYLALIKNEPEQYKAVIPPPLISCSEFVPKSMVELLMRKKKNSALGVKFVGRARSASGERTLDEITDMEGAMHSFVTPVVGVCEMVGDYRYDAAAGGHGVCLFGDAPGDGKGRGGRSNVRVTRSVAMSASIQMDFENPRVMLMLCKLDSREVVGCDLARIPGWSILTTEEKQDEKKRKDYDESLRRHMVFHLTRETRLPGRGEVADAMDVERTVEFLEGVIRGHEDPAEILVGKYAELYNDQVVSLELLFNAGIHQARNEFSALEAIYSHGYVYTYDPASIFAHEIGAPILNRLMLAAMKYLSNHNRFEHLRVFAFNDYADTKIMSLVASALEKQPEVQLTSKKELFNGHHGGYDIELLKQAEGSMLVVHNNSDGFGQNIETEYAHGSLDGAVGSNSSAAASLYRGREDLLDFIL